MRQFLLPILCFFLNTGKIVAQQSLHLHNLTSDQRTGLPRWAELNAEDTLSENEFFQWLKSRYQLHPASEFRLLRSDTDDIGMVHRRFVQYFQGKEVLFSMLILHLKAGVVESFNGEYYRNFESGENLLSKKEALNVLLKNYGATRFKWQDSSAENWLRGLTGNADATWFPTDIKSVYYFTESNRKAIPCYTIPIATIWPVDKEELVIVDAIGGNKVIAVPMEFHTDSAAKAKTYFEGIKKFTADFITKDSFRLRESKRLMVTQKWQNQKDYFDKDNYWDNPSERIAGDVHLGAETVMDIYKKYCNQSSWDGYGGTLKFLISIGSGNAYWFRGSKVLDFMVDTTSTVKPTASLDVVGHEAGHAFLDGLVFMDATDAEGCAIHEGFADISGHLTEFYADSIKANWQVGEKVWFTTNGIRNMRNPWLFKHAKAYGGRYWPGECHTDNGVLNYWFYIQTMGDTATNEFGYTYKLKGLGHYKAARIHYRGFQYYMIPTGKFADVMKGSIKAAKDIFGGCSDEVDHTMSAWKAVNVIDTSINPKDLSHGIRSASQNCNGAPVTLPLGSYGDLTRKVWWQIDYKDTFNQQSISYTFNQTGAHNIYLITHACNKIFYDSMKLHVNLHPHANFTSPFDSSCSGASVDTFKNTTINSDSRIPLQYFWTANPGNYTDTTKDFRINFPDGQDYEIQLKAYYDGGCWDVTKSTVHIRQTPHPSFDVIRNVCQNRELRLRNTSDTGSMPVSFTWFFPDSTSQAGYLPQKQIHKFGKFKLLLTGNYFGGKCTDTAVRNIDILPAPVVSISIQNTCRNEQMQAKAIATFSKARQWTQWLLGSYSPYNKDSVIIDASDSATRTIGFTAGDSNGCYTTAFQTVPLVTARADGSIGNACLGQPCALKNNSVSDYPFSSYWVMGNGKYLAGDSLAYSYSHAGKFIGMIVVQSSNCRDTMHIPHEVFEPPVPAFTAATVCAGNSTIFVNNSNPKTNVKFVWNFGDNDSSTDLAPIHLYPVVKSTTYFVTLTATDSNGCNAGITKTASVNELPKCNIVTTADAINPAVFGFKNNNNSSGNWKWYFGDGDSSDQYQPYHAYRSPGNYSCTLRITNGPGCSCENIVQVQAGVNAVRAADIALNWVCYPNPTNTILNIFQYQKGAEFVATLYSADGKLQLQQASREGYCNFNTSQLSEGIYLVSIKQEGSIFYSRLQVLH